MRESDIYPAVREWLSARGYTIHVEVFDADIVAVKDGMLTVVELKLYHSNHLSVQVNRRCRWADFVYAAVPAQRLRTTGEFKRSGIGVLEVEIEKSRVRERIKPKPQPWWWRKRHDYRAKKLSVRAPAMPHEIAGVPCNPALKAARAARTNMIGTHP